MVNGDLVLKLLELYSAHPENFPRVLSTILRRETLQLVNLSHAQLDLINDETSRGRASFLSEHLKDFAEGLNTISEFLEYFRDIPLGKNSEGNITTGEDIRIVLVGYFDVLMNGYNETRCGSRWDEVSDEQFQTVKQRAREIAQDIATKLERLDSSLALAWTDSEPDFEYLFEGFTTN